MAATVDATLSVLGLLGLSLAGATAGRGRTAPLHGTVPCLLRALVLPVVLTATDQKNRVILNFEYFADDFQNSIETTSGVATT